MKDTIKIDLSMPKSELIKLIINKLTADVGDTVIDDNKLEERVNYIVSTIHFSNNAEIADVIAAYAVEAYKRNYPSSD